MPVSVIVEDLNNVYKVPGREAGIFASVRSLFRRKFREVVVVDAVSFELQPGEVVGFLGPNEAGKTTTLKLLTSLRHPDGGDTRVLAFQPWRRERDLRSRIALGMGQRNNLAGDLPAADYFELNRAIYQIPGPDYRRRVSATPRCLRSLIWSPRRSATCRLARG